MKPFRFRLEALLALRKREEERCQIAFAQAEDLLKRESDYLCELSRRLEQTLEALRNNKQQHATIDMLNLFQNYLDKLNDDIKFQQLKVDAAVVKRDQCLQALAAAVKNRKLVEKLKEKNYQQYQAQLMATEQKLLDEMGTQLHSWRQ